MVTRDTSTNIEHNQNVNRSSRPEVYGDAHPKSLLRAIHEEGEHLVPLENQHVLSADQFDEITLLQLFRLAVATEVAATPLLR